jgi:PAS domain S-box-containing protein
MFMASEQERPGSPLGIVLSYILIAALWILFSDLAVVRLIHDQMLAEIISLVKGWLFVAVTATFLYVIIGRKIRMIAKANWLREEAALLRITEVAEQERCFAAEARLERSLLKTLVGTIPDLVWLKDGDGVFLTCNHAFELFYGAKEADIIGKTDYDFVAAELADFYRAKDLEVIAAGRASRYEGWVTFADDGHRAVLETFKTPMVDTVGRLIGVLGIARDVTATRQAREVLQERVQLQEQLEKTAAAVPGVIYTFKLHLDGTASFPYASPGFEELAGFSPVKVRTHAADVFTRVYPDDQEQLNKTIAESARSMAPWHYEFRVRHPDKGDIWVEGKSMPKSEPDGCITWHGFFQDITERKRAEEALRESEATYRSLFDNMLNGFAYCRMLYEQDKPIDFIYLGINDAFVKLTGLQDVVGRKVTEIIPGIRESDSKLFEIYGRVALTGNPERFERYVEVLHDWYWISVYSPKREHFVAVFDVITERKRAEESLRQSEQRFRLAMDATSDGLWDWDVASGQTYYSPGYFRMLGYEPGEWPATFDTWLTLVHPEDRDRAMAVSEACIRNESQTFGVEFRMRSREGDWLWILGRGKAVRRDTNKRALQMIGTHVDITERKRAEAEREKVERLESLGLLAGGIAHDFNNILTAVIGNVSLARMRIRVDHGADERLADCEKALDRAVELVRQLHTFSRGGAPVKGVVDIEQLLREVVSFALHGSNCKGKYLISEGLRNLDADAGQICQALNNLTTNAVQAMPEGGIITIAATNEMVGTGADQQLSSGPYVKITISDQGTGIPAENLGRIFDPYFTTKPAGTGIGLASVFSIVMRHGGNIGVSSVPGEGAIFTIMLPAADVIASSADSTSASMAIHPADKSILVMDDEEMIRELAVEILKDFGYLPVVCMDGAEAVALYRAHLAKGAPFAAVVLDMTVPGGMGGKEAAVRILEIDPDAVLIISSGYAVDAAYIEGADPIFRGSVSKPYNVRQIAGELARLTAGKP